MKNSYDIKIHKGGSVAWDASDATLEYLKNSVKSGMHTCETGAGKTSLLFAAMGANHTAVTPSQNEVDNIANIAKENKIDLSKTRFVIGFSQDVLPGLEFFAPLDLVLIDGGHGFPIPQIDFVYLARHLKDGGKLLIDDIDVWTGKILVDFLKQEEGWKFDCHLRHRTAIFTKTKEFQLREWCDQKYVNEKSKFPQIMRKAKNALALIFSGKFSEISRKFAQEQEMSK